MIQRLLDGRSSSKIFDRTLPLLPFILNLIIIYTIIKTPPASGYEISIYQQFPYWFWPLLILSSVLSYILIYSFVETNKYINYLVGIISVLFINLVLLSLHLSRGYLVYGRGDVLSHLGYIRDIIRTGYIGTNLYPVDHILSSNLLYICNFDLFTSIKLNPIIFYLLYFISIYLLSLQITGEKKHLLFSIILSAAILLGYKSVAFAPFNQSIYMVPFVLYLFLKSRYSNQETQFSILLIFILLLLVFFHPLTCLFLIIIFLNLDINNYVVDRFNKFQHYNEFRIRSSFKPILFLFVVFFIWQSYAYTLITSLRGVYLFLIGEAMVTEFQRYGGSINIINKPNFYETLELISNRYGQLIIIGCAAIITILYVLIVLRKCDSKFAFLSLNIISILAISLLAFFSTYVVEFDRYYGFLVLLSIILVPFLLSDILYNRPNFINPRIRSLIIYIFIITIFYFSIFNLYASPITHDLNQQVTRSEMSGMDFVFAHRNDSLIILEWGIQQERFYDALFGSDIKRTNILYGSEIIIPVRHFGYDKYNSISGAYKSDTYLLLTNFGKLYFPTLFSNNPNSWYYTPEEFIKLDSDHSVNYILNNGNVRFYLIKKNTR